MFSKIEELIKLIKLVRYGKLSFDFTIYANRDGEGHRWVKKAESFDSAFDCLGALIEVLEPLGGIPCVDVARAGNPDLHSCMVVTFLVPKKHLLLARSNAISVLQSKKINRFNGGDPNWTWFTLSF